MIRGISVASIPVRNQDAALKFYTEKLGFKILTDQPFNGKQRWIELLIPGAESKVALFTPEGHETRIGGFQPLTFWCDDVPATHKILKSKGVEFDEVVLDKDPAFRRRLYELTGGWTVPQIVIDGRPVGGYTELHRLEREGRLDDQLAA